ncbi:MAG: serine kinase [Armatimonadetes bacterium]|nr:serine kinase [Armatimonadota bacterium]
MLLNEVIQRLGLAQRAGGPPEGVEVTGGYSSDLLSDVIGNAGAGHIWVTIQIHQNIVAVATLLGLSAVVIAGGAEPEEKTIEKADEEGIRILTTPAKAYEVVGRLYELGIR